jgi:hypothetical protein
LDRFRRGRTTLSVAIQPGELAPGDAVVLSYEVGGELDEESPALETGLTCIGQYIVGERGRDANGHPITRDVVHELKLHEDERELPISLGPGQVQFELPTDAQPTSADVVEWVAWAKIGSDGDEQRIAVPVRLPGSPPAASADAAANGLTLHGVPDTVRAGGSVGGTLTVALADETKAHDVSVRLIRRRTYVAEPVSGFDGSKLLFDLTPAHNAFEKWITETQVFGKHEFEANSPEQNTFEIQVPADAGPDTAHPNGQVDWRVEAALHRMLHDDLTVAVPIKVF